MPDFWKSETQDIEDKINWWDTAREFGAELWRDMPFNPYYWKSPREKAIQRQQEAYEDYYKQTGIDLGAIGREDNRPIWQRTELRGSEQGLPIPQTPWIPEEGTREITSPGERFTMEWIAPGVALSALPTATLAWKAAGQLSKPAEIAAKTALSPLYAMEQAPFIVLKPVKKIAEKAIYSPIKALIERPQQLPEKTITHTYDQLVQAHRVARNKGLVNKKTGKPTKSYRNLAEIYTGKTSTKDMSRDELDTFITALSGLEGTRGKPPKIPKVSTLVSKEFWDGIPFLKDVGAVDYFRQKPKVLQMLNMNEFSDDMLRAEVNVLEEKNLFLKELTRMKAGIGKDAVKKERIFDALENPLESHLLDPDEQQVFLYARQFADKWADRLNIPQSARTKNYITHLFDKQMQQDVKEGKTIPLEILKSLEFNYPRKTYMPFLKQRTGKEIGLKKDPFTAMEVYESYALRQKYFTPLLQKLSGYINMFEARGKTTSAAYLKDMSKRIAGRPSKEDILINESMGGALKFIGKMPGIKSAGGIQLEQLGNRGNLGALVAHNMASLYYMAWLGFRPVSAIRNFSQQLLAASSAGVDNLARGIGLRFTQEGKVLLKESLVMRGRLLSQPVAGLEDDVLARIPQGFQNKALAMFKFADKQNVADSFLAGYSQGKRLGLPREWAIKLGDEVAANTQYLYTKMARSLFEDTTAGRFLTPFTSWPRNFFELMTSWVQGRQSIVLNEYMKQTGKTVAMPSKNMKPLLTYMTFLAGAYATEGATALRATEYTGWTSIANMGKLLGGDIPAWQIPRGLAYIAFGAAGQDSEMVKKGWSEIRPDKFIQIVRQLEGIAEGKIDPISIFLYLDREQDGAEQRSRIERQRTRERRTRTRR